MLTLVFTLLSVFSPIQSLDSGYFYFGNTNVIGVGLISEGEKTGEWKVYSKSPADQNPIASLEPADPLDFKKKFNQDFPVFIVHFEKGVPNGPFLENFPNGKPKVVSNLKGGVLEGDFGEFYEGGELRLKGKVLDGKKEGEWQEYSESGKVISSMTYSKGLLEGKGVGYYPDGELQKEVNFKNGVFDGPYAYYLPDSTVKIKGQFAGGIPVGEWIEKLEIIPGFYRKGTYQNGFKEGEWQLTNLEGGFLQAENYKEGKLISVGKFQSQNPIEEQGKIKNGKGQRYFYDENGNVLAKGKISKGTENGTWFFYYPESNRISASGKLVDSERVGTWNFYSYEGEIIDQTTYIQESSFQSSNSGLPRSRKSNNPRDSFGGVVQGQEGTGIFGQGWNLNTFQNRASLIK